MCFTKRQVTYYDPENCFLLKHCAYIHADYRCHSISRLASTQTQVIKLFCSEVLITFKEKENPKPLESLTTIIFMMRSSYVSYMYPDTECKATYVLLAAKTAAVIPLKAFSSPEPSLTPSSLPSNKFFLKSVEGGRGEGQGHCLSAIVPVPGGLRGDKGVCSGPSQQTGVLTQLRERRAPLSIQYPHRVLCPGCWPCTASCPCSQARGHSPPLCCSGSPPTLCLPVWTGSM